MAFNWLGAGAGAGVGLEALLARLRADEDSKVRNSVAQQEVDQRMQIAQMTDARMRDQLDILDKQRRDIAASTAADHAATQARDLLPLLNPGPVSAGTKAFMLKGNPGLEPFFPEVPGAQVKQMQGYGALPQSAPSGLIPGTAPGTLAMKATPVTPPGSLNTTADPTSSLNAPSTINFTGIAPKQTASKEPVPRALQHVPVTYKGKPAIAAFDPESGGMQIIPDMAPPPSASGAGGAAAGPPGPGQFTPDSLERAAVAYRITGKMPPLGMGKQPERFALLNKVAEQDKILGLSPAASVQKQFATHADAHALDTLQNLSSTAEASETKALGQIAIIRDVASKVPRTQYPFINAAIQSGKINLLGDSDSQQLANAIQTYASEYGKIIEGSTGSVSGASDASMKAAKRLVDASMNPQTLNDVLSLMQREMDLTLMGYGAAITHVTEQMIGNGQAPAAPPPQTPPPATPPPGATRNLNTMKSRRKALGLE